MKTPKSVGSVRKVKGFKFRICHPLLFTKRDGSPSPGAKHPVPGMAREIFPKAWHTKMAWSGASGTLLCQLPPFSG